ncbi:MAG: LemA family protein [Anaerovoracaceae bacterium]|nr:LemA family protein [Anaerovoracaceae bacterium]
MAFMIVIIIIAVIIIWMIASYNGFVRGRNNIEEAFATMDVYLKKRYDLIPNLVETVKGYMSHEQKTLKDIVELRDAAMSSGTVSERARNENEITRALGSLFAVAENYPDLKANQNFMDLQGQLARTEEDIANARKYYNAVVKKFNNRCETFPGSIIAGLFHFERRSMFEVENAAERENVKVDFGA